MNPLLVIAAVTGIVAYLMNKGKTGAPPVLAVPTLWDSPVGINTGFATPPIQTSIPTSSPGNGASANQPGTSASGVPQYAPQTATQFQALTTPPPNPLPGFYETFSPHAYDNNSQGDITPIIPASRSRQQNGGCGCGGSKGGGRSASTSCSSARGANSSADCLAPSKDAQYINTDPSIFRMWADNLQSQKYGMFAVVQDNLPGSRAASETDSQNQTPASPFLDGGLGIGNRASVGY